MPQNENVRALIRPTAGQKIVVCSRGSSQVQNPCFQTSCWKGASKLNYRPQKLSQFSCSPGHGRALVRVLNTLSLTPTQADVIPVRNMVCIRTDRADTSFGASIHLADPADCDTSIWCGIFGESSNPTKHSLRRANAFTHKLIRGPFVVSSLKLRFFTVTGRLDRLTNH